MHPLCIESDNDDVGEYTVEEFNSIMERYVCTMSNPTSTLLLQGVLHRQGQKKLF